MRLRPLSVRLVIPAIIVLTIIPAVSAQEPPPAETPSYRVHRVSEEIRVDGTLDEIAWSGPATLELTY